MNIEDLKESSILILGLGREGADSYRFFRKTFPNKIIGLADKNAIGSLDVKLRRLLEKDKKIVLYLGAGHLKAIGSYDLVVKSPGIPVHLPEIAAARRAGKLTSQTKLFFDFCPGTIIGVTGTKGKSTTSALIYEILKKAGKRVKLLGNIGKPILTSLAAAKKGDFFVLELSCHQLYDLERSPRIGVLLNIYPEHLDYYKDYNEYIQSKANIAIHQAKDDYLIYNSGNAEAAGIAARSKARKIRFNEYSRCFSKRKFPLIGEFNRENAKIAVIVGGILKIPDKTIDSAIAGFKPLPHRLELTGCYGGIEFYNDSLSTIQESAVAAIDGLGSKVQTLIAGGFDRGQGFGKLAEKILSSGITNLILFPTTGSRLWAEVEMAAKKTHMEKRLDGIRHFFTDNMPDAVKIALRDTGKGRICLMSCASSSFSVFRDYEDRGKQYKRCLVLYSKCSKKRSNPAGKKEK